MNQPQELRLTPDTVATLIQLKETDQKIGMLERELARQPAKMDPPKRKLAVKEAAAKEAGEVVIAAKKRIDSKTVEADSIQAEVQKLENQLFTLKTTTEFDAMKGQIKAKQDLDDRLQTEVLELMEGIGDLEAAKEREEQALEVAKADYKKVEGALADDTKAIEDRLAEAKAQRVAFESELPEEVRTIHDSVCERRGTGVASIVDEICKGCDTRVTVQTINAVMGNRMVQCPHCDRILYVT